MQDFITNTLQSRLPKSEPFKSISTTIALGAAAVATLKVGSSIYGAIKSARRASAAKARRAKQEQGKVYIFGFPKFDGVQYSTPCERVEIYCKIHNIPYDVVETMDAEISDTGRLPCVELNGKQYNDSKFIIDELETVFGKAVEEGLDRDQQSSYTSFVALFEHMKNHHYRNTLVDNPEGIIDLYTKVAGFPRFMVKKMMMSNRKNMIKGFNLTGYGDVSDEQYVAQFLEDMKALEHWLSKNKFAIADKITKADCLVAPWIKNFRRQEALAPKTAAFAFAISSKVFEDYLQRVDAEVDKLYKKQ